MSLVYVISYWQAAPAAGTFRGVGGGVVGSHPRRSRKRGASRRCGSTAAVTRDSSLGEPPGSHDGSRRRPHRASVRDGWPGARRRKASAAPGASSLVLVALAGIARCSGRCALRAPGCRAGSRLTTSDTTTRGAHGPQGNRSAPLALNRQAASAVSHAAAPRCRRACQRVSISASRRSRRRWARRQSLLDRRSRSSRPPRRTAPGPGQGTLQMPCSLTKISLA